MVGFLLRRVLMTIPVLIGITLSVFVVMRVIPGDPALAKLGVDATPELLEHYRTLYQTDLPLGSQLVDWLRRVATLDFGESLVSGRPLLEDISVRLPATVQLAVTATLISLLIGVPLGAMAAWRPGSWIDVCAQLFGVIGISIPGFWLGLLLILWLALGLGWFPIGGYAPFTLAPGQNLRASILPAITLATGMAAVVTQFARAAVAKVLRRDYVRTAHGKGVTPGRVLRRHVLRNALTPVVTVVAVQLGSLLGGAVIVEDIYAWPGIGQYALMAIHNRDYTAIQTVVLAIAVMYVFANFIADVLYGIIDPRITYE